MLGRAWTKSSLAGKAIAVFSAPGCWGPNKILFIKSRISGIKSPIDPSQGGADRVCGSYDKHLALGHPGMLMDKATTGVSARGPTLVLRAHQQKKTVAQVPASIKSRRFVERQNPQNWKHLLVQGHRPTAGSKRISQKDWLRGRKGRPSGAGFPDFEKQEEQRTNPNAHVFPASCPRSSSKKGQKSWIGDPWVATRFVCGLIARGA